MVSTGGKLSKRGATEGDIRTLIPLSVSLLLGCYKVSRPPLLPDLCHLRPKSTEPRWIETFVIHSLNPNKLSLQEDCLEYFVIMQSQLAYLATEISTEKISMNLTRRKLTE